MRVEEDGEIVCAEISFNSLFEIRFDDNRASNCGHFSIDLSILFLRFEGNNIIVPSLNKLLAFNSLFEILTKW